MNGPGLRVLVVDDHAVVREGLARILGGTGEGWKVGEASSGFQALDWLRRERADVVVVDLSMPGMNGLELVRRIRAEFGRLPVLVLSMHAAEQFARRAISAGASGYLTKDTADVELVNAVTKLVKGGKYFGTEVLERVVLSLHPDRQGYPHERLSDREFQVLRMIGDGRTVSEIATELTLSVKTVSTHKANIQHKLGVSSTAELVRYALEHKLVE